ncbi:MAG: hypothetical protein V1790_03550 [Planctomycetota bacterium]
MFSIEARVLWIVGLGLLSVRSSSAQTEGKGTELPGFTPAAVKEIERLLDTLDKIRSYSDAGAVTEGRGSFGGQPEQIKPTVFEYPNRFKVEDSNELMVSDGRNLTVVRKSMRRYVTEPLRDSWRSQVEKFSGFSWNQTPSVAKLILAADRRAYIGQQLQNADVRGREIIDGENCTVVEGVNPSQMFNEQTMTSRWYLRERDGLLRRVVNTVNLVPPQGVAEGVPGSLKALAMVDMDMTTTYDVKDIRVDAELPAETFLFQPKKSWKKVAKFYDRQHSGTEFDGQIALSGKPVPWFELPLAGGGSINSEAFSGKVGVLWLFPDMRRMAMGSDDFLDSSQMTQLDQVMTEFPQDQVVGFYVLSEDASSPVFQKIVQRGIGGPLILDPEGTLREQFVDESWGFGFVLLGKDGTVQGLYQPSCEGSPNEQLKADIEQLIKGDSLPGGVPMGEEEIKEMRYQRRISWGGGGGDFEPLNEERLVRAWSVRTRSDNSNPGGFPPNGDAIGDGLWVRTDRSLRRVNPQGQVIDEIRLAPRSPESWFPEQMLIARTGKGRAVLTLSQIPITFEVGNRTTSYPGEAMLVASNEQGEKMWDLPLGGDGSRSAASNLAAADIDGKAGDEIVFVNMGGLWIVSELGEALVRMPVEGYSSWVRVQDLDADGRSEVYIRYHDRLERFDYTLNP